MDLAVPRAPAPAGRPRSVLLLLLLLPACSAGAGPYRPPDAAALARQRPAADDAPRIERGRPNTFLDGLNHYVLSLPTKLLLWEWDVLDHRLPEPHEALLRRYLDTNGLRSVKVRHNQYDPFGEMGRLVRNEEVAAGYRYTLGLLSWLRYTLLPDRLLAGLPLLGGGDHFNPFSNTMNVYSSDTAVLLHEAGHAKDYVEARWKGTYMGLLRLVPFVDLWHEAVATDDAVGFLQCAREREAELDAYEVLFPAYATYVSSYLPLEASLPVLVAGHVTGQVQSGRRARALDRARTTDDAAYAARVLGDGRCMLPPPPGGIRYWLTLPEPEAQPGALPPPGPESEEERRALPEDHHGEREPREREDREARGDVVHGGLDQGVDDP